MPHLSLHLLGRFQTYLGDDPITTFESDKVRALLCYLSVEQAIPHERAKLAALFWPEWSDSRARANLRHALAMLRTSIGDRKQSIPFLLADYQSIQFNIASDCSLDVLTFEAYTGTIISMGRGALGAEDIRRLARGEPLYRGPFLDGFSLQGCAEFETWMAMTRTRLERRVRQILGILTEHHIRKSAYSEAEQYACRQLEIDPLHEETYRHLMRILALRGERTAALTLFEQCRQMLDDQLAVAPSDETVRLHKEIQTGQLKPAMAQQQAQSDRRVIGHVDTSPPTRNAPRSLTPFFGRKTEQKAISALFLRQNRRLVTLHGTGGVGKTRLAQEVARGLASTFNDGVYWVELTPLSAPDDVILALADALGVHPTASRSLPDAVKAFLQTRHLLLLLDNFEHLMPAAPLVADLLTHTPSLSVLVTSREVLHIYSEQEYRVQPLFTAEWSKATMADFDQTAAVRLFVQRARLVQPEFQIDVGNAAIVAQICRQLDGLPLALELAAAQLKYRTPAELLLQLRDSPPSGSQTLESTVYVPARHRSLAAAINWSYALLSPHEQQLFRTCAVIASSFTLAALDAICVSMATDDVRRSLYNLIDKNLVQRVESARPEMTVEGSRIIVLNTIRDFGMAELVANGELTQAAQAYVNYYLSLVETNTQRTATSQAQQSNDILSVEYDNIRAIIRWVLDERAFEIGFRLAKALWPFWMQRGGMAEAHGWICQLLDHTQSEPPSSGYAAALLVAGISARFSQATFRRVRIYLERCVAMSRALDDQETCGFALAMLAGTAFDQGKYSEARRLGQESLRIRRELGIDWQTAMLLINLGFFETMLGNFEMAQLYFQEGLTLQQTIESQFGIALTLNWMGVLARVEGNWERAQSLQMQSNKISEGLQFRGICAHVSLELGRLQIERDQPVEAERHLLAAIDGYDEVNSIASMRYALCYLVQAYSDQGRHSVALELAAFATRFQTNLGIVLPPMERAGFANAIETSRMFLGPRSADIWANGETYTLATALVACQRREPT